MRTVMSLGAFIAMGVAVVLVLELLDKPFRVFISLESSIIFIIDWAEYSWWSLLSVSSSTSSWVGSVTTSSWVTGLPTLLLCYTEL